MSFSSVNLRRIRNFFQKWQITRIKNASKWQTTIKKATNWWLWYRRTKAADAHEGTAPAPSLFYIIKLKGNHEIF